MVVCFNRNDFSIFITLPLFILKAEQNSNIVIITSIFFMWLSVIETLITKKNKNDSNSLLLKPKFKNNIRKYIMEAYIPSILIAIGTIIYFICFPNHLDLSLGMLRI